MHNFKTLMFAIALLFGVTNQKLYAQTSTPHIYKDWTVLGETKLQGEVFYRIIRCGTSNQIHLYINNKLSDFQTVNFELNVTSNTNGESFTKGISCMIPSSMGIKAECTSNKGYDHLKIDLPETYNPDDLTIAITFRE